MYIVAIAWLYVVLMMAITERSVIGAVMTLFFYGVFPLGLFLWVMGGPARARRRREAANVAPEQASVGEAVHDPNRADPKRDEADLLK